MLKVQASTSHSNYSSNCAIGMPASFKISARIVDSSERAVFHVKGCSLTPTSLPPCLVLLVRPLPPVRHVAAGAAVELLGNVVVTSWAATPIVRFGFHVPPSFQTCFACVIRRHHCEVGNLGNNTRTQLRRTAG